MFLQTSSVSAYAPPRTAYKDLASFKQALTACHSDIRRGRPKTLNKAAKDSGQAETNKDRKKPMIGTDGRSQVVLI